MKQKTSWQQVVFEQTPVVFTPLDPKGKHPELVVVDLRDLIKASDRHRKETKRARQEGIDTVVKAMVLAKKPPKYYLGANQLEKEAYDDGWNMDGSVLSRAWKKKNLRRFPNSLGGKTWVIHRNKF